MFCTNCGGKLRDAAKFCGSCGTKVEADGGAGGVVKHIDLAPLAEGLPPCQVEILGVEAEGPDDDGDLRLTVKYEVRNDTEADWEMLEVRIQLLTAEGKIVEENRDLLEQTVSAGESEELEGGFWGVKAALFGGNADEAHVVLSVTASTYVREGLGTVSLPEAEYSTVALPTVEMADSLNVVGGAVWKTAPDDDKDCRVEVKLLVQNLTDKWLPRVKVEAQVNDKSGRELTDAGGNDEVRPGAIVQISGSGYEKAKKFAGATVDLGLGVYLPVAAGVSQRQGARVVASETPSSASENDDRMQFNCREIVYSIIKYQTSEYKELDLKAELSRWKEELESNSVAYPVYVGSPFDDDDGHMDIAVADYDESEGPDDDTVYVILYYFYESADYYAPGDISNGWQIQTEPLLAEFDIACPMKTLTMDDREESFECDSSTDKTETRIAIYQGRELMLEGEIDDLLASGQ